MFRIIINSIFSLILLITTSGFTISEHYCVDRLVSVSIDLKPESCCDMEGGCCHTKVEYFKLEELVILSSFDFTFKNEVIEDLSLANNVLFNINILENVSNGHIFITESPPALEIHTLLSKLQTYLL